MLKRIATLCVGTAVLCLLAAPVSAKNHAGEKPEPGHKQKGGDDKSKAAKKAPAKKAEAKGNHPEPGDDKGVGKHGKDDGPNHK